MKPGPPAKPTPLRVLHGEKPYRIDHDEPLPRPGQLRAPDWMSEPAREVFERTVRELHSMGMAFPSDLESLVVYANAVVTHSIAQQIVDTAGVLIKGQNGVPVKNPATTVLAQTAAVINRYAREFGLTPSARVGLGALAALRDGRDIADRLLS